MKQITETYSYLESVKSCNSFFKYIIAEIMEIFFVVLFWRCPEFDIKLNPVRLWGGG